MEELPEKFEYVVVGTGLTESLVAAALSRIGKTVLHIDRNDYYSGLWATFGLRDFTTWLNDMKTRVPGDPPRENALVDKQIAINPEYDWGDVIKQLAETEEEEESTSEAVWTQEKIERLDRHFNIDIIPKFVFARGATVENLLESDAGRYLEFLPIRRLVACRSEGEMLRVPANRSELFKTKHLTPKQKWQISSFLQWSVSASQDDEHICEFEERPLREMLAEWKGMDEFCQQIVINTMALAPMDIPTRPGLERLQKMLSSLNRYGPYPFMWPLYGSGELPQAYCRFSAVFGGVYCLGRSINDVQVDKDARCDKIVLDNGQEIGVEKDIVVHSGYLPAKWADPDSQEKSLIARAIFLTNGQFHHADNEEPQSADSETGRTADERDISLLSFQLEGCREPAIVIELPPESKACPRGTYLVHITATIQNPSPDLTPQTLFEPLIRRLFRCPGEGEVSRPVVLWSAFYLLPDFPRASNPECPSNLHLLTGPDSQLDFDSTVNAARALFNRLCPGDPFLPKAPSADEILILGDDAEIQNPAVGEEEEPASPEENAGDNI